MGGLDHVNSLRDIAGVRVVVDEGPQPIGEEAGYALCYRVLRRLATSPYVRGTTSGRQSPMATGSCTPPRAHVFQITAVRDPSTNKGHGRRRAPRLGGAPGLQARCSITACCRRRVNLASCHL